jgi:hypothetical protein
MAKTELPSPEMLRKVLDYDPETGFLTWKERGVDTFKKASYALRWNRRYAGMRAFTHTTTNGYKVGMVFGLVMLAHKVAFAIHHGRYPERQIDHINGDKTDNRALNLRDVSCGENAKNKPIGKRNTSGHMNITWDRVRSQWEVRVKTEKRAVFVGRFRCLNQAVAARNEAHARLNFHPNHGRSGPIR